jgi:hypothetical protein
MSAPAAPLTDFCEKLASPEILLGMVAKMTAKSGRIDNRATTLSLAIMGAAGDFTKGLHWKAQPTWEGSVRYLRDTSSDVIAAEAIVWLAFLMGRFWKADQKNDREMFERIGFVTVGTAGRLAVSMIEDQTGIDFTAHAVDRRKFYLEAEKDTSRPLFEAFASIVLSSVGRRSPTDPLRSIGLPPPEWTPLSLYVATFFSTMPAGFYETFKRMLLAWPDRFPHDHDFGDE